MSNNIDCPVGFNPGVNKFGAFANAFRIMQESGEECFLDFCVYSAQENSAQVVARLRIHQSFIPIIHSRLGEILPDVSKKPGLVMKDGLLQTQEGNLVLLGKVDE